MKSFTDGTFRLLLDSAPDPTLIFDVRSGQIADVNPALLELLGAPRSEVVGHTLHEAQLVDGAPSVEQMLAVLRQHRPFHYERRVATRSGAQRTVQYHARLSSDGDGEWVHLRLTEPSPAPINTLNLRFLTEAIPGKISIARADGYLEFVNSQWLDYLGFAGRDLRDARWHQFTHAEDLAATVEAWQRAMSTGMVVTFERRIRRKDGAYRWHLGRIRALVNGPRPPILWIGVDTDIDDQKSAASRLEASEINRTLEMKELVGQMETFSYTMAHDLRGPLRTMQGYAQILAEDYGTVLDDAARNYLQFVGAAARRMHKLVTEVLTYTRITADSPAMMAVSLQPVIEAVVAEMPALAPVLCVRGELPIIWGDPTALNRVFAHLLSNALKFVRPSSVPHIELYARTEGAWATLYFADNGCGIAEADHERIFRMFERINPSSVDDGAGIGLAIVRKTVSLLGGTVGVESQLGQGSTFWVKLRHYVPPAKDAASAAVPADEKVPAQ